MRSRAPRTLLIGCATAIAVAGGAVGTAGAVPDRSAPDGATPSERANPGRGNSGGSTSGGNNPGNSGRGNSGGNNPGNSGRGNPITTLPPIPVPPAPVVPGAVSPPRNPLAPSTAGSGGTNSGSGSANGSVNRPAASGTTGSGSGSGSGAVTRAGGSAGSGSATGGGTSTAPVPTAAVPRTMPTSGLAAGRRGPVDIRYFVDLGDLRSASSHLAIMPTVLARITSGSLGTISLRPLMTGRDANSTEAACALVAASQQNRAWVVAHSLATARTTLDGDWLRVATLRSIGRHVAGLSVARFVSSATGRACYRQLTAIRTEARVAHVGSSPAYVVKGTNGTRVVMSPTSADAVMGAIAAVT